MNGDSLSIVWGIAALTWGAALGEMMRTGRTLRDTTLSTAAPWAYAAASGWIVAAVTQGLGWLSGSAWQAVALVLSLTPIVAVLGARRPTCRVWPWFVLAPLIVVLLWPVVSMGLATGWSKPIVHDTPQVVIYGLVVVMGCGNYVGTRQTDTAVVGGLMLWASWACSSRLFPWSESARDTLQVGLAWGLALVTLRIAIRYRRTSQAAAPLDRVWDDFVQLYGLVWSRRLWDRLQALARQQAWTCEVTPMGLVWPHGIDSETTQKVEHAYRWLLRRFVEPGWLDARLGTRSETVPAETIDL